MIEIMFIGQDVGISGFSSGIKHSCKHFLNCRNSTASVDGTKLMGQKMTRFDNLLRLVIIWPLQTRSTIDYDGHSMTSLIFDLIG